MSGMPRWRLYYIGMWICFAVAALAALGEYLGWWREFGEFLMWIFTLAGLGLGLSGASDQTVGLLRTDIADLGVKMSTNNRILERIEQLLSERLPPPA